MTVLSALTHFQTAAFYYVLGGFTFLPTCAFLLFLHFWLTAPVYNGAGSAKQNVDLTSNGQPDSVDDVVGEGELSEERKRQAMALAVWNHDAQKEARQLKEKATDDDGEKDDVGIPTAAKRVKPAPPPPRRPHQSGWLTVRRHFHNDGVHVALHQAAQQAAKRGPGASTGGQNGSNGADAKGQSGYMSMVYRGMLNYRGTRSAGPDSRRGTQTPESHGAMSPDVKDASAAASTSASASTSPQLGGTATPPSTAKASTQQISAAKETFYCILKGPILYLYSSADPSNPETECQAAIDVRGKRVSIFVSGGGGDTIGEPDEEEALDLQEDDDDASSASDAESGQQEEADIAGAIRQRARQETKKSKVRDGELFVKRNAIRIVSMGTTNTASARGLGVTGQIRYAQWFIFAKNATSLEDWYHTLLSASKLSENVDQSPDLISPVFQHEDMANLLANLDAVPDPIPLRWLNAMVGRIFFSIYRTSWLEHYVASKIRKKMSRVRTPGFLSDMRVREVDLGSTPPAFSRPILKSLTGEGEASMEVDVHYTGSLRLTISTVLTLSLGQRFKQYSVTLVLAVILNSLEGNLLLHIKPPPSNRIWFGFTSLPKMDISVEPVVSERKVQWSMVKRLIEGRIRELLTESLVVPNMDDIPFFDTRMFENRGGIWAEAAKEAHRVDLESTTSKAQEVLSPPTADPSDVGPQSKSTPASVLNVPVGGPGEGSSTSVDGVADSLRNRRTGSGSVAMGGDSNDASLLSSSPAAAGLSALLARDQAANSLRSPVPSGKASRRTWFAGNGRQGASKLSSGRKSDVPQSSLAWGSASLSDTGGTTRRPDQLHERNKDSIASMSSIEGERADLSHELENDEEELEADSERLSIGLGAGTENAERAGVGITLNSVDGKEEILSSGRDLTEQADTRARSEPRRTVAPAVPPRPVPQAPLPPPQRNTRPVPSPNSTATFDVRSSPAAQSLASIQRERYASGRDNGGEDAAIGSRGVGNASTSAMFVNSWNKAKASMADKDSRQAAAKDAKEALKRGWASWNARRSGVPVEEANSRMDTIVTSSDRLGESSNTLDSSSSVPQSAVALALDQQSSSWLASSPEDPASLGVGFDGHGLTSSPSVLSLDNASLDESAAKDDAASSRASSTIGRKPYREHLADKVRRGDAEPLSRASSRASSSRSVEPPTWSTTPPRDADGAEKNVNRADTIHVEGAWDGVAPGLSAPLPAAQKPAQKPTGETSSPRQQDVDVLSSSPTIRRTTTMTTTANVTGTPPAATYEARLPAASPSTEHQGVNKAPHTFLPGQSTATIGLSAADMPTLPSHDLSVSTPPNNKLGLITEVHRYDGSAVAPPKESALPASTYNAEQGVLASEESEQQATPAAREAALPSNVASSSSSSSTAAKGIKQQPTRAAMMAVPGIPSMQKAGIQSFEAPPPPPTAPKGKQADGAGDAGASVSPRLGIGNLIARIPSFGAVSGAPSTESTPASVAIPADAPGATSVTSSQGQPLSKEYSVPPPLPTRPSFAATDATRKANEVTHSDERVDDEKTEGARSSDLNEPLISAGDAEATVHEARPETEGVRRGDDDDILSVSAIAAAQSDKGTTVDRQLTDAI